MEALKRFSISNAHGKLLMVVQAADNIDASLRSAMLINAVVQPKDITQNIIVDEYTDELVTVPYFSDGFFKVLEKSGHTDIERLTRPAYLKH